MFDILPYNEKMEARWDHFVIQESFNGTFLQSRKFLNYHPEGRFNDASFLIEKSGTIVAAFPGNITQDGEWISHQGSTFGGPIILESFYTAGRTSEIIDCAEEYLKSKYKKIRIKPTAELFSKQPMALLDYILEHKGYTRHSELSSFIELSKDVDPLDQCDKECRRCFRQSLDSDIEFRDLKDKEFPIFYKHLCISKEKHNTKPVHTLEELVDLKNNRISEFVRFKSLWKKDTYIAGMMMFDFKETNVLHAQYISPNEEFTDFQPTTAIYIRTLQEAAKEGFNRFSFGISTEDCGNYLNMSLIKFKESFGSKPAVNLVYTKEF
ncbi:peptidoglycan bridge formation glycyltransferase FemA/FemB family protein [Fibrobacter sp.]|uniref:peptidoglycan bridge formation glycyltransferase FemA/FemB family protein n=1 Tax=Fibrobacter sp. TaxID=35828 RepID=UPI003890D537